MTVAEYRDKFAQLSRYAPNDIAEDKEKQRRFLKGLYDGMQLQLMSNTYPNFQSLVNHAIVIDDKRKEMEAKKRRLQGQASRSNTHPRAYPQQGFSRGIKDHLTRETMVSILSVPSSSNTLSTNNSLVISVPRNRSTIRHHARECPIMLL